MPYEIFTSDMTPITDVITLDVGSRFAHSFGGIRYYNSAGVQITPTAGTVLLEARHLTNNMFDTVVRGTLDATSPGVEAEWGGNVIQARATPTSLAGTDLETYQLVVIQNQN